LVPFLIPNFFLILQGTTICPLTVTTEVSMVILPSILGVPLY
jgi:hypothetical protein